MRDPLSCWLKRLRQYQRFLSAVTRLRGERLAHHWQVEHDQPAESFTFARRSSEYLHSLREKC